MLTVTEVKAAVNFYPWAFGFAQRGMVKGQMANRCTPDCGCEIRL
jgi:hypothetical protein